MQVVRDLRGTRVEKERKRTFEERERGKERIKTRREKREKLSNVARVRNDSRSVPAFSKFSKNLPACPFERLFTRYFSLAPSFSISRGISFKAKKARGRKEGWIPLRGYP